MLNLTSTITAKQIRDLNIKFETWLSFDFENETYFLVIDGNRAISFSNRKTQLASHSKIQKMLLGYGGNKISNNLTDEERGIIQAVNMGENPFAGVTITDSK